MQAVPQRPTMLAQSSGVSKRWCSFALPRPSRSVKVGKLVLIGLVRPRPTPSRLTRPAHRPCSWRCGDRGRVATSAPCGACRERRLSAAAVDGEAVLLLPSPAHPASVRAAAMVARRSLSFTRSSSRPVVRVCRWRGLRRRTGPEIRRSCWAQSRGRYQCRSAGRGAPANPRPARRRLREVQAG